MNAQRHSQLEQQLATLEQTLLARLRFLLPDSARPGSSLFTSRAPTSGFGLLYFVPPVRGDLCIIAGDCVRLRRRMSLPAKGTLAQALLDACSGTAGAHEAQCELARLLLQQPGLECAG